MTPDARDRTPDFSAVKGQELGVVDELVEGDLLAGAIAFARKVVAEKRPLRLASQLQDKVAETDPAIFADIRKKNEKKWKGLFSPWKIVECVEKACTVTAGAGRAGNGGGSGVDPTETSGRSGSVACAGSSSGVATSDSGSGSGSASGSASGADLDVVGASASSASKA